MRSAGRGYEKKGMKTMFGKRYPNCVKKTKKSKKLNLIDEKNTHKDKIVCKQGKKECYFEEEVRCGNYYGSSHSEDVLPKCFSQRKTK